MDDIELDDDSLDTNLLRIFKIKSTPKISFTNDQVLDLPNNFDLLSVPAEEMAKQITLINHSLYAKVMCREFIGLKWSKPNSNEIAPNITSVIAFSNHITYWVATKILTQNGKDDIVEVIKYFIEVANYCIKQFNFNGAMEILIGLQVQSVHRLKNVWSAIPEKIISKFEKIREIFNHEKNWSNYRQAILNIKRKTPTVPFLGMVLTDVTLATNSESTTIQSTNLINFRKFFKVVSVVSNYLKHQKSPFFFQKIDTIADYIRKSQILSAAELRNLSYSIEKAKRMMVRRHSSNV